MKIRFPFQRKTTPSTVELPFNPEVRSEATFKASLVDLPVEKVRTLEFLLRTSTAAYQRVELERQRSQRAAQGGISWPTPEDVGEARAILRSKELKQVTPSVKRLLKGALDSWELKARPPEAPRAHPGVEFLAGLRELAAGAGELGAAVLCFAEALLGSDQALASQLVNEAFEVRLSEALGGMARARRSIVKVGVVSHSEIEGELVDELTGEALPDEQGNPRVEVIPFRGESWVFNGKKRPGCSEATLDFYHAAGGAGPLVSLSEAVLMYQRGELPTPEKIWRVFLGEPKKEEPEAAPSPAPLPGAEVAQQEPFDDEGDPIPPASSSGPPEGNEAAGEGDDEEGTPGPLV